MSELDKVVAELEALRSAAWEEAQTLRGIPRFRAHGKYIGYDTALIRIRQAVKS